MMRSSLARTVAPVVGLALAAGVQARPDIGPANFSGSEQRVNFDGLTGGATPSTGDIVEDQYLSQGIIFINPNHLNHANNIPSNLFLNHTLPNTMFVDQGGGVTPNAGPLTIYLYVPVNRIGMYIAGSANVTFTMKVYGASGLLETLVKPGNSDPSGSVAYLGIQRPELITRAVVSCASNTPGYGPYNFIVDDVQFEAVSATCYANCDGSTAPPVLNANDFQCFLNKFAASDSYANCDGSGAAPVLNANDFQCYLNSFAVGCS